MRPSGRQSAAVSSTPQRPHGGAGVLEPMPLRYVRTYGLFGTHLGHYVTALAASTRRRACACPENSFTAQCRLKRQSINSNAIMIGGSHACTKPWRSGAQQRSQARLPRQVRNLPRHATLTRPRSSSFKNTTACAARPVSNAARMRPAGRCCESRPVTVTLAGQRCAVGVCARARTSAGKMLKWLNEY